jgi:ribosomal protein S18 acetylase RimI-like enzyme
MKTNFYKYDQKKDFLRVRNFLVDTYSLVDKSVNWTLERWNYARYFVLPMIGAYAKDPVSVEDSQKAIRFWEDHTRLWKNAGGEVVAVTALEYPWLGDVFFLRYPGYDFLLEDMFTDAESNLVHPEKNILQVHIFDHDEIFQVIARNRGYRKDENGAEDIAEYVLRGEIPEPKLPPGYVIQSMAEVNDLDKRRKAFGRGFNHEDPIEWPNLFSYQELQKAPDYRPELDLYVMAPDGEFVSFCILWWDQKNHLATLEPVGTVPNYRRKGLARAVVYEAIRRAAALGVERVLVGSGQEFYLSIGFKKILTSYSWVKTF